MLYLCVCGVYRISITSVPGYIPVSIRYSIITITILHLHNSDPLSFAGDGEVCGGDDGCGPQGGAAQLPLQEGLPHRIGRLRRLLSLLGYIFRIHSHAVWRI